MKNTIIIIITFYTICTVSYSQKKSVFTDLRDGNEYEWIRIGHQIWMAENLAYLPKVYSAFDEQVHAYKGRLGWDFKILEKPFQFVYGYDGTDVIKAKTTDSYKDFGVLYNYSSAKESCPDGWHLPSDEEWMELEKNIGMKPLEINIMKYKRGDIANKLKSEKLWSNQVKGTDDFGFAALPSGVMFIDPENEKGAKYVKMGKTTFFWTATEYNHPISGNILAIIRSIDNVNSLEFNSDNNCFGRYRNAKCNGFSVRCVKD